MPTGRTRNPLGASAAAARRWQGSQVRVPEGDAAPYAADRRAARDLGARDRGGARCRPSRSRARARVSPSRERHHRCGRSRDVLRACRYAQRAASRRVAASANAASTSILDAIAAWSRTSIEKRTDRRTETRTGSMANRGWHPLRPPNKRGIRTRSCKESGGRSWRGAALNSTENAPAALQVRCRGGRYPSSPSASGSRP